jgi:hypothetical protein
MGCSIGSAKSGSSVRKVDHYTGYPRGSFTETAGPLHLAAGAFRETGIYLDSNYHRKYNIPPIIQINKNNRIIYLNGPHT